MNRSIRRDAGIEEAIVVCAAFNLADRIADTFDYVPSNPAQAARFGETRLARGYKL